MEEKTLDLEKAAIKNLKELSRKTAATAIQGMGGLPTYASIVAPPATKAAVWIRVQVADNMQPTELLYK